MKTYGWHFVGKTLRDGSPLPKDGEWLEYEGVVNICRSGLHFSDTPWQALQYAPGEALCYVELENIVERDKDKGVCTRRKIIARGDATEALRYFARMQAISVLDNWEKEPDQGVLEWLLTGDKAAWSAARSAAESAAKAWSAAESAARSAAWSAAEARYAARYAARSAAESAAWSAARSAAEARSAARYAAWSAAEARSAAWSAAAEADFNALIYECFEDVLK
jgi:hypothetical protein